MYKLSLSCLLLPIFLTACATAGETKPRGIAAFDGDPRLGERVDKVCFTRGIDSFSDNTQDTVVLRRGPRDEYLVTTSGFCAHLDYAQSVGLRSRTSCLRDTDQIYVSSGMAFGSQNAHLKNQSCFVDEIYKWDSKAAKTEALADANTKTPDAG